MVGKMNCAPPSMASDYLKSLFYRRYRFNVPTTLNDRSMWDPPDCVITLRSVNSVTALMLGFRPEICFSIWYRFSHFPWMNGLVSGGCYNIVYRWWRHQMETFSALLAFCAGNSSVTVEFLAQRPAMRSFDVFFDLHLNQQLRLLEAPVPLL